MKSYKKKRKKKTTVTSHVGRFVTDDCDKNSFLKNTNFLREGGGKNIEIVLQDTLFCNALEKVRKISI